MHIRGFLLYIRLERGIFDGGKRAGVSIQKSMRNIVQGAQI